jgi:serine protease Do
MPNIPKRLFAILPILFFTGCMMNQYALSYRPMPGFEDAAHNNYYDQKASGLTVYSTDDFNRDLEILASRGYLPIGVSAFNASVASIMVEDLRAQGEAVGAHAVLIKSKYSDTIQGAVSVKAQQTGTTYSSKTVMMPYAVDRYNVGAIFLAKTKIRLGISVSPLNNEDRQKLQTNSAVRIFAVVEGSPAFYADILPGDYLMKIADKNAYSIDSFGEIVKENAGKDVDILLIRGDQELIKHVHISSF